MKIPGICDTIALPAESEYNRKELTNMKKLTSLFLTLALTLGLTACSGNNTGSSSETSSSGTTASPESAPDSAPDSEQESAADSAVSTAEDSTASSGENAGDPDSQSGKALVVYYSGSGHTEQVAEYIAAAADADLFEITPAEPYTSADLNYNDANSRVSREHDDESLRDVELTTTDVDGWADYDVVFIGYPIWWGIAAWPVNGFVKANDFTGKTVIPFATSASSGMGQSGTLLADMAGSGNWQDGQRFRSSASADEVNEWVNSLEF